MQAKPYITGAPDESRIIRAAAALGVVGGCDATPTRMLGLLCDPQVEPRQVSELIRRQPALCARVLRVANSPYYGQSRAVRTLERAFLVLGIDAVRGIAAAACLDRTAQVCKTRGILDLDALLDHCVAVAAAAEQLARLLRSPATPETFIAGLMHDFGFLILLSLNPDAVAAMVSDWRLQPTAALHELEARHIGLGHARCAAVAFESWALPPSLIAAAMHHHDPMGALPQFRTLTALVNLGESLAMAAGFNGVFERTGQAADADAMCVLGIDEQQLATGAAGLADRVRAFRGAMAD